MTSSSSATRQLSLKRAWRLLSFVLLLFPFVNLSPVNDAAASSDEDDVVNYVLNDESDERGIKSRVVFSKVGQNVVLECEVAGSPAPTLHWTHADRRLVQSVSNGVALNDGAEYERTANNERLPMLKISATKSRLFLDCVTSRDAGRYSCVADTPDGRVYAVHTLIVGKQKRNLKQIVSCQKKGAISPDGSLVTRQSTPRRVYMWTSRRLELTGADVQLCCRTTSSGAGSTMPQYWVDPQNHKISPLDRQYQLLETGDLLIKNINFERNMGLYRCIVEENESGGVINDATGADDEVSTFLYPTLLE